ncbi:type II toxin-antitoxin system Phd/YefM family antitoxin [Rhizobium sp. YIM 134829]|uniref:type II toxin-antitoxin system Phd/YefM family antitoxin n=1 Tax=Rhizobium sp. YIM 134829 TaxID=3390453 RepID=UPI0039782E9B
MRISIDQAAERLPELVRRVQQGEEVVLTLEGGDVVRLTPSWSFVSHPEERLARIKLIQQMVQEKNALRGEDAARSQDFLYDDNGLPA